MQTHTCYRVDVFPKAHKEYDMTDIMQKKFKIFKYSLRKYTNASFSRIYNQFHLILYSLVHEWIITNGFLLNIIWLLVFQIHWNLQI